MVLFLRCLLLLGLLTATLRAAEPGSPPATPRKAELGVYILDITDIDEPGGKFTLHVLLGTYWQDPAMVFDGKEPKVLREDAAMGEVNTIWRPMVEFNRTTAPAELHHALLRIHPDGRVEFERQLTVQIATMLDLRKLPFDTQHLKIELESFQHLAGVVELTLPPENLRIAQQISLPQWAPGRLSGEVKPNYREEYDETYSRATVTLEMKRHTQFYIWQMMVPLGIVLGMAFAVFFLPPKDLSDRMSVIIASLLTVVALSYSLHSGLPKISYLTVIDWFFVLAYVFLGLAMAGMVWISNVYDRDEARAIRYDQWLRWAYPGTYVLASAIVVITALN
jgi:Neurotransmitter-gated ion-channel ligand binding domain/Neurotransmitter-gated ion-channel transmembrane region